MTDLLPVPQEPWRGDEAVPPRASQRSALRRPSRRAVGLAALGLAPLVAGSIVGVATNANGRGWYRRLSKPSWTPPDAVFGPVWTILYLMMGGALVLVAGDRGRTASTRLRRVGLGAFGAQLVLNLGWSIVFFGARRLRLALGELVVLWAAIAATIVAFARVRPVAGLLLVPYLAWTTFAGLLNLAVARRNPGR